MNKQTHFLGINQSSQIQDWFLPCDEQDNCAQKRNLNSTACSIPMV